MSDEEIREYLRRYLDRDPTDEEVSNQAVFQRDHRNYKVRPNPNDSIRMMLQAVPDTYELVQARTWQLLRFAEPCLMTSDAPVALWQPPGGPEWAGIGFGTAHELRLPIDRQHALILAWDAPSGEISREAPPEAAVALNQSVMCNAYRWLFYHPDQADPPLDALPQLRPAVALDESFLDAMLKFHDPPPNQ